MKILFSKECRAAGAAAELQALMEVPKVDFPIKYLGLPLTPGKVKHADCGGLLASLSRWRGRKLSYMGRVQLLNWTFNGKMNY